MVAEADIFCEQTICSLQFNISADAVSVESESVVSLSDSGMGCAASIQTSTIVVESPSRKPSGSIRSGSHTDIGPRKSNEDEHIRIDDVSSQLGSLYPLPHPCSFYAVFDGHGGSEAASYLKEHAMRLFFIESDLPQTSNIDDDMFLQELENCHCRAFLLADQALADECSISSYCGTTALTALILGKHLVTASAGDCRAVLCRKGVAVQLSQDHRPCYLEERIRVEALGGFIKDGYLNGELAVTRALGDWHMKSPSYTSPLIAMPDVRQTVLTDDDEFLIIACDGIWDVMSNQEAVGFVRRHLRLYDDPDCCARELVNQALRRDTSDNLTAIVVCFSSASALASTSPGFRCSSLTEEARNRLRNLLQGN
ncbi:hypothetical protein R6Q59_010796 [Mikania micrantha]